MQTTICVRPGRPVDMYPGGHDWMVTLELRGHRVTRSGWRLKEKAAYKAASRAARELAPALRLVVNAAPKGS